MINMKKKIIKKQEQKELSQTDFDSVIKTILKASPEPKKKKIKK